MIKFFVSDLLLAIVNLVYMCINIAHSNLIWTIYLPGTCLCIFGMVYALKTHSQIEQLKEEEAKAITEIFTIMEKAIQINAEAGGKEFHRLVSPYIPKEPKRRESGENPEKRLMNLALHHRKARVRKKNAKRILKDISKREKAAERGADASK